MSALDDHLQAVVRAGVPGVVALAAGPGFAWENAAGVADANTGAPLTTDHRFGIGSVTKTFVAAVVLQLVGEGVLALDEEVGQIAEGVTLRHLLNHTSGVPDHYADLDSLFEPYRQNRASSANLTPRTALELVHARPTMRICVGHLGFSFGYTTIALSSESGDRQVVVCANTLVMSDETWKALGRLVWACYCD
jgi:D-alanyl-D-alanine carboxypeptidase